MRVLFISHDATRSGAPLALLQLVNVISKHHNDIEMEVLFLNEGDILDDFRQLCPIRVSSNNHSFIKRLKYKILRRNIPNSYLKFYRKGQFDCIYANTVVTFRAAVELGSVLSVPLIGHVHEAECSMFLYHMSKELLSFFSSFIAVSQLTANNLEDKYDVPKKLITIQSPYSPWVEKYLNNALTISPVQFDSNQFIIGTFCREGWWKAIDIIPILLKDFFCRYPQANCKFVVVGHLDDDTCYRFQYELKHINLIDKVIISGETTQPLKYHAAFDLFLLLSREESFSLVAQEAGVMKTPIIGFEGVTGAAEWIKDNGGVLVPYLDIRQLSDTIYMLLQDDALRRTLGQTAFEAVAKSYHDNNLMSNIIEVIRNSCQNNNMYFSRLYH